MANKHPAHTVPPSYPASAEALKAKHDTLKRIRKEASVIKAVVKTFLDEKYQLAAAAGLSDTGVTISRDVLCDMLTSMPETSLRVYRGGVQIGTVFFVLGKGDGSEVIDDTTESVGETLHSVYEKFSLKEPA